MEVLGEGLDVVGWGRVRGVVGPDGVGRMVEAVWAGLAARGVERGRRETWPVGLVSKNQGLRKGRVFDAFGTAPATVALVDGILGPGQWHDSAAWGPALVTFPEPGPWVVPHKVWHLDLPGRGDPDRQHVVRLFGYVSDVVPGGGGTLVVEGSHELVRRMVAAAPGRDAGSSSEVRKRLVAEHPWFRALCSESGGAGAGGRVRQFMTDGDEIDGVRVRVAELTADAGDVVVMQPWTMHNFSMNCADEPRFMVTHTIWRQEPSTPGE